MCNRDIGLSAPIASKRTNKNHNQRELKVRTPTNLMFQVGWLWGRQVVCVILFLDSEILR